MNDAALDIEAVARAQVALRRAAVDPNAAIAASALAALAPAEVPASAGVAAPRQLVHAVTLAVIVEPPAPLRRWRFFVFYCLIRLAARVVAFNFELYRPDRPWD